MTEPLYLSRVSLKRTGSIQAIASLLAPYADGQRMDAGHKLLWILFGDDADRERDFLWREAGQSLWYVLSTRPPEDKHGLFEIGTKVFDPALEEGSRVNFVLRVNATIEVPGAKGGRSKRQDIIATRLSSVPQNERQKKADEVALLAMTDWMKRREAAAGFEIEDLTVIARQWIRIPRGKGRPATIATTDVTGTVKVKNALAFRETMRSGLGRAKAFGCGMMMIKPAPSASAA
jgi:CRISPR system Cascade subunit CasE